MKHLTDEQFAEWLAGESGEETRVHLQSCERCQAEANTLQDGIRDYTISLRQQAGRAQSAQMTGNFVAGKVRAQHRLRWAGAGILAVLLAAQTAWILMPRRAPAGFRPGVSAVVNSQLNSQPNSQPNSQSNSQSNSQLNSQLNSQSNSHPSAPMSDDELLEAVSNDLSRDVPQALAPVSEITAARNKIAAAFTEAAGGGNISDK